MLTGAELLNRVKELGDCAKTDLARGCGYVVQKKDGSEQVKFTAFYEALLEAKGLSFSTGGSAVGKGGRKLSYKAVVQGNGNLLIGKAYTALLELQPRAAAQVDMLLYRCGNHVSHVHVPVFTTVLEQDTGTSTAVSR